MWIVQEPNMLDLWNKLHFEEEKTEYWLDKLRAVYNRSVKIKDSEVVGHAERMGKA